MTHHTATIQPASEHIEREGASLFAQAARAIDILDEQASVADDGVFKMMAARLGAILNADVVGVTEVVEGPGPQALRVRADWSSDVGIKLPPFYEVVGSPCGRAIEDGEYSCASQVHLDFPDDPWLEDNGLESFFAVAFPGPDGRYCGHLCVASRQPCKNPEEVLGVVRMCASYIGRELQRRRVEGVLTTQRSILELVARGAPLQEVLDHLCLAVERLISGSVCSLMMREGNILRFVSGPTVPQVLAQELDGIEVGVGNCGAAVARGVPGDYS